MIDYNLATTLPIGTTLYHITLRNADGSALRARINGRCRTWKRQPGRFELPMKHGLRTCFYIADTGRQPGTNWLTYDPTEKEREAKRRADRKRQLRKRFNLTDDTPDEILHDRCLDAGMTDNLAEILIRY